MINCVQQQKKISWLLAALTMLSGIVLPATACQNKKKFNTMSEQTIPAEPADTTRLLTVANLEQTDSGRKLTVWFFETPQVFEFSIHSETDKQHVLLLKQAKETQTPVNIQAVVVQGNNIITRIFPATETQIIQYQNREKERGTTEEVPAPKN